MYKEYAFSTDNLTPYMPYPQAKERASYQSLPAKVRDALKGLAEENLNYRFSQIPMSAFMEFTKSGNRMAFEDLYFPKRRALNALVLGECIEYNGKYLENIINGIFSLCEESAWQLPAHNSYVRDSKNLPLPDVTDPVIDLFAAETGALLALVSYLLHDELENFSPAINKMILANLKHRIFEPYINRHFWWMGNGDEPMCNWTVWCTQNVLLSVFLTDSVFEEKPEICGLSFDEFKKKVIEKSLYSIDCFLKDYGDDGCCDEGALYYGHSALCLFNATQILNSVTNGAFSNVFKEKKIKNIASYIFNVQVSGNYYVNFADCSAVLHGMGAREFLFAKEIGNEGMMRAAALDYQNAKEPVDAEEINLFHRLQEAFTADEMLAFDTSGAVVHDDVFYESTGLLVARDDRFVLAVKAGDNDDSHNHNDVGSFTIYKDSKPLLIDVGVETYSAKTFSDKRYEIWTMQSAYHNLPTVNNVMQHAGASYKATGTEHFISKDICDLKTDIAGAYPKEAGLKSYVRQVSLYKNRQIVIKDSIGFARGGLGDNEYFLSLMVYDRPDISENKVILGDSTVEFLSDVILSYEEIPIEDARLKWAWKHSIYRIIVLPKTESVTIVIS